MLLQHRVSRAVGERLKYGPSWQLVAAYSNFNMFFLGNSSVASKHRKFHRTLWGVTWAEPWRESFTLLARLGDYVFSWYLYLLYKLLDQKLVRAHQKATPILLDWLIGFWLFFGWVIRIRLRASLSGVMGLFCPRKTMNKVKLYSSSNVLWKDDDQILLWILVS